MPFVRIANFPSRLEAETIGHALDPHEIPFLVKSADIGMFGPGMTGTTPDGASLWVAEEHAERVAELLTCVVGGDDSEAEPLVEPDAE